MRLAVISVPNQLPPAQRSRSLDSGRNSGSPSVQEEQLKPSPNQETLHNENNGTGSMRRHSLESIDSSPGIPNISREYLDELKRRSLPYQPQRSSSLTFPPQTPPESTLSSSPTDAAGSCERVLDEALASQRRSWVEWWRGVVIGRRESQAPIPKEKRSSENGHGNVPIDNNTVDVTPSGEGTSSGTSESLGSTTTPPAEVQSSRYLTPLRKLWTIRGRPIWRPAVHPVVYGFRSSGGDFNSVKTALDIGCEVLGGPSKFGTRAPEEPTACEGTEADSDVYHEGSDILGIASGSGSDGDDEDDDNNSNNNEDDQREPSSHIENAKAAGGQDEDGWQGESVPLTHGRDPRTPSDHLNPVGNPPPTPRPAHRSLPFAPRTPQAAAGLGRRAAAESRRRAFSDAELLMNLRFERRFGGGGGAESLPQQHQNDASRRVTVAVEEVGQGSSAWEAGEAEANADAAAGAAAAAGGGWERAGFARDELDSFRPLERVRSHRDLYRYA